MTDFGVRSSDLIIVHKLRVPTCSTCHL